MFLIWFFIFDDSNDLKIKLWRLGGSWLLLLNKVFRSNPAGYFIHTASVSPFVLLFLFLSLCRTQSLFLFFKHNMFLPSTFSLLPIFFISSSLIFFLPVSKSFVSVFIVFLSRFVCYFVLFLFSHSVSYILIYLSLFFPYLSSFSLFLLTLKKFSLKHFSMFQQNGKNFELNFHADVELKT